MAKPKTKDERALRRKLRWYGGRGGPDSAQKATARRSRQSVELPGMWQDSHPFDDERVLRVRRTFLSPSLARQYRRDARLHAYVRSTYIELPMREAQS